MNLRKGPKAAQLLPNLQLNPAPLSFWFTIYTSSFGHLFRSNFVGPILNSKEICTPWRQTHWVWNKFWRSILLNEEFRRMNMSYWFTFILNAHAGACIEVPYFWACSFHPNSHSYLTTGIQPISNFRHNSFFNASTYTLIFHKNIENSKLDK